MNPHSRRWQIVVIRVMFGDYEITIIIPIRS